MTEENSNEYEELLPLEEELEQDKFIRTSTVGYCPKCGSKNTDDCENEPSIRDITIGICLDCGAYWCLECGYVLTKEKNICPHWEFCDSCRAENGYLLDDEFMEKICSTCEYYKDGCQLDPDDLPCEKELKFQCPHEHNIMDCSRLRKFMKRQ